MDIKEIALKVASELDFSGPITISPLPDHLYIDFATALLAEIQKQNEPVAWRDGETGFVSRLRGGKQWQPLYLSPSFDTFPPSVEAIENKVAEACAAYVGSWRIIGVSAIAEEIRSGEWRKHMKGSEMSNYCQKGHWENGMKLPCKQCEIESLQSRIAELESQLASKWQPIETAPKTGREIILLLTPSKWPQVAYSNTWWTSGFSVENKPTHWMPLPTPPIEGGK